MAIEEALSTESGYLDVGAQRVGTLYAKALLGATERARQTDAVLAEFDSLLRDVLDQFPKLEAVLRSNVIAHENKVQLLDRIVGPRAPGRKASPLFLSFLKVVSRHGRLDCLRAIHRAAHDQLAQLRGMVRVKVTTAAPLDEALSKEIESAVRQVTGGTPLLERRVNPHLLGGVLLQIGDRVFDGSVATQLARLRTKMIDRSVHVIQSQRDRVRHPGGN